MSGSDKDFSRKYHVETVSFDKEFICVQIDGQTMKLLIAKVSKKLNDASDIERNLFKISFSGCGIHWPLIDEDLSVDAFLKKV